MSRADLLELAESGDIRTVRELAANLARDMSPDDALDFSYRYGYVRR